MLLDHPVVLPDSVSLESLNYMCTYYLGASDSAVKGSVGRIVSTMVLVGVANGRIAADDDARVRAKALIGSVDAVVAAFWS